jgi:hypothetical protein
MPAQVIYEGIYGDLRGHLWAPMVIYDRSCQGPDFHAVPLNRRGRRERRGFRRESIASPLCPLRSLRFSEVTETRSRRMRIMRIKAHLRPFCESLCA